jgi:hypothetical protein
MIGGNQGGKEGSSGECEYNFFREVIIIIIGNNNNNNNYYYYYYY